MKGSLLMALLLLLQIAGENGFLGLGLLLLVLLKKCCDLKYLFEYLFLVCLSLLAFDEVFLYNFVWYHVVFCVLEAVRLKVYHS